MPGDVNNIGVHDLDWVLSKYVAKSNLTTGPVSKILQLSKQYISRACDSQDGWIQNKVVFDGSPREITVKQLVDSVKTRVQDMKVPYLKHQLLHFFEVAGLDSMEYGLPWWTGSLGFRFYTQETLYGIGKAAPLMYCSYNTVMRCVDNGKLEGFKLPRYSAGDLEQNEHFFRRVLSSAVVRFLRDSKLPAPKGEEIPDCPESISYPDPFCGYEKQPWWSDANRIAQNEDQSVWCRTDGGCLEVSVRKNHKYGMYCKFEGLENDEPRIDLILLGEARKNIFGISQIEHLGRVYTLLGLGNSLVLEHSRFVDDQTKSVLGAIFRAQERLEQVYSHVDFKRV